MLRSNVYKMKESVSLMEMLRVVVVEVAVVLLL